MAANLTLQEGASLLHALNDFDCRKALQAYFRHFEIRALEECRQRIIQEPPDVNRCIQAGAAAEVYRTGFTQLEQFCASQLEKAKA